MHVHVTSDCSLLGVRGVVAALRSASDPSTSRRLGSMVGAGRSRTSTVLGRGTKPHRSAGALRHSGEHLHFSALSNGDVRKAAYSVQEKGARPSLSLH